MKNNISIILAFALFFIFNTSYAQHVYFPNQGTISYEKTIFIQNLLKRYSNYMKDDNAKQQFQQMVTMSPATVVFKKSLAFNNNEIRFDHIKEEYLPMVDNLMRFGILESGGNTYENLKTNELKSIFELGGQDVLIQDSLMNIKWKITDEYRNIAGYNCRRANGLVLDSVYVVAYYTDEIPVSAGPSCFRGLPGMILGVAVPELHYNMFATKVDMTPVAFIDPNLTKKKVKPQTRKAVYQQLNSTIGGYLGERVFNLVMAGCFL